MQHTPLNLQSNDDFIAYTNSIDFGAFVDAVIVAGGVVTGTFKDATQYATQPPPLN